MLRQSCCRALRSSQPLHRASRPCVSSLRPAIPWCCRGVSQATPRRAGAPCRASTNPSQDLGQLDFEGLAVKLQDYMPQLMQELVTTTTKTAAEETVQDVFSAMAAAEAAQAACMATGRLAEEAAKGSKAATELLQAYSTAQQLYHKTYRRFLERHQQLAVTPAGGCTLLGCLCALPSPFGSSLAGWCSITLLKLSVTAGPPWPALLAWLCGPAIPYETTVIAASVKNRMLGCFRLSPTKPLQRATVMLCW